MGETTPRTYIIGIIIFTIVIVAGLSMFSEYRKVDDSKFTGDLANFTDTFNRYEELNSSVSSIQQRTQSPSRSVGGVIGDLIEGAWETITLTFTSFSFMTSAFSGMTTIFGVPAEFVVLVGLIITVIIAFTIFSLIFQGRT